jgi:hypothetical protein
MTLPKVVVDSLVAPDLQQTYHTTFEVVAGEFLEEKKFVLNQLECLQNFCSPYF